MPFAGQRHRGLRVSGLVRWAARLALITLISCRSAPHERRDSVRIAVPYEIDTLDPHAEDKLANFGVLLNIYEPVVMANADLEIRPALASRWESPGPRTWIFHLRPFAAFHSGKRLESGDVVYSIERVLNDPDLEVRTYLADVEEVVALDKLTVRITTRRESRLLLNKLANVMIVPAGSTKQTLSRSANGTGRFRLVAWRSGSSVRLVRNDGYWGEPPALREVEYALGSTPEDAVRGLIAGQYQLVQSDSKLIEQELAGLSRFEVKRRDNLYVKHLGFDLSRAPTPFGDAVPNPFRDPRVRRATSMALDRERIVAQLPTSAVATLHPFPRSIFGFSQEARAARHDPEGARRLLEEAGLPDGFDAVLVSRRIFGKLPELIKEELSRVGVRVEVQALSDPEFFQRLQDGHATLWVNRYACSTGDAGDFLEDVLHSRDRQSFFGSYNYGGHSNPALDRSIEDSLSLDDMVERRARIQEIVTVAMNGHVVVPLYFDQDVYAVERSLSWQPRADSYVLAAEIAPR